MLTILIAVILTLPTLPELNREANHLSRMVFTAADLPGRAPKIRVLIVPLSAFPTPIRHSELGRILATATLDAGGGGGCLVRLTEEGLERRPDLLAHEVCHCVYDRELMTERGVKEEVTHQQFDDMEDQAQRCGEVASR